MVDCVLILTNVIVFIVYIFHTLGLLGLNVLKKNYMCLLRIRT